MKHNLREFHPESINYQFVPPKDNGVNAANSAIQTFKNHFISDLFSTEQVSLFNYGTNYYPEMMTLETCTNGL